MPRISDEYLECVVYLYPSIVDAEQGARIGGSGFVVSVLARTFPGAFTYVVTNHHIIENGHTTIRFNLKDGSSDVLETEENVWISHPSGDDLAVLPVQRGNKDAAWKHFPSTSFLTKETLERLSIGIGDDVFTVGRFVAHDGRQRNLPTARFGNIAQMPWEPIHDKRFTRTFQQESFLIESRLIGGFSGSPVFVWRQPGSALPGQSLLEAYPLRIGPFLLGVTWGQMNDWWPVCDSNGQPLGNGLQVRGNSGIMPVVPAWKLQELLNVPLLQQDRELREKAVLQNQNPPAASQK